ncbi:hypothetical protein LZ554_007604 [Drepanopeziza brunnea f. sp. 'monogermtubi']|nr:hypothetical protein LZ554_007604 [Drepanopeziza brunnea f. sp. 'monogermtubi']
MVARRRSLCSVNSLVSLAFVATIIVAFMVMMGETPAPSEQHTVYSTVTGYFLQDEEGTDPKGFDFTTTNFGLIDRKYTADADLSTNSKVTQWQRFAREVTRLNGKGDSKVTYKLLYLGRHGEGYHNVAEAFYGTDAWNCHWSLQDGNSTSTWADALLTPTGEGQALKANAFWRSLIADQKVPTPQSYYASPLMRCLATANLTFSGLDLPKDHPFIPTIKEGLREVNGAHTCDRRSRKSVIRAKYPDWPFEEGFTEEDVLWKANLRETDNAIDQRTLAVLDDVFASDKSTYISISAHSGEIGSMLRVLGHREFGLGTGQAIPVLVKAEQVPAARPPQKEAPWEKVETCSEIPPAPAPTAAAAAALT